MRIRNNDLKIAIVGCGPAGLAAALVLRGLGYAPEIFERFDAARPLGSGIILQPTGLRVLNELGLGAEIAAVGQRIDRIIGYSEPSHRRVLNVNYATLGKEQFGIAIHRSALFNVLLAAARNSGIKIHTGREIDKPDSLNHFDLLVDASGARSALREHAPVATRVRQLPFGAIWGNFEWPGQPFAINQLEQRYVGAHTMIGVLPLGAGLTSTKSGVALFWSLPNRQYDTWRNTGLDSWKKSVLKIWPETAVILDQINSTEQMVMARYAHHTMRQPYANGKVANGIVYIGDAAHATSPQLGQGANMALLDAWALGHALAQSRNPAEALPVYAASRRWHVRGFQLASLALTPFYQSNSRLLAGLRDLSFDFISRVPGCRRIVSGLISGLLGDPLGKVGLDPGLRVKGD